MREFVFELVSVEDDKEVIIWEGTIAAFTQDEAERILGRMRVRFRAESRALKARAT